MLSIWSSSIVPKLHKAPPLFHEVWNLSLTIFEGLPYFVFMKCWLEDEWGCEFKLDRAHTRHVSNGAASFIQSQRHGSKKYHSIHQTNISLWGILGKNVWYFDIFSAPPRYKGEKCWPRTTPCCGSLGSQIKTRGDVESCRGRGGLGKHDKAEINVKNWANVHRTALEY